MICEGSLSLFLEGTTQAATQHLILSLAGLTDMLKLALHLSELSFFGSELLLKGTQPGATLPKLFRGMSKLPAQGAAFRTPLFAKLSKLRLANLDVAGILKEPKKKVISVLFFHVN